MHIDIAARRGYLDSRTRPDEAPPARVDLDTGTVEVVYDSFPAQEVLAVSRDGSRVALTGPWITHRGTNKTELGVLDGAAERTFFTTKNYLAYSAAFCSNGGKLLVSHFNDKLACHDVQTGEVLVALNARLRVDTGSLDAATDTFWAADPRAMGRLFGFRFEDGSLTRVTLPLRTKITSVRVLPDGGWLVNTEANSLHRFDLDGEKPTERWRWEHDPEHARIATCSFMSGDGTLVCAVAHSTADNLWGEEFVLDAETGAQVNSIPNTQGRGRVETDYLDSAVLLFTGRALDLRTGAVGEPIWPV